ncbi:guanine deaminase [Hyphomicrobium sp. CS1GBMeth3]|uniref:guanine deaminase n=1 Tax=Hyphomicrobium sp. CS1GBMeth3 TaxID=1892845 RepID=UPI00093116DE|nr:guanine deaminase [Hyphomicrobium sp. CS1GBMeth3]
MPAAPDKLFALRGQTLSFRSDPFRTPPDAAVSHNQDGLVVIGGGKIVDVGPAQEVLPRYPGIEVESHSDAIIMAGFVDCHVHYPQLPVIASYGEQLLEWLNKYTFPAESKFGDYAHARATAETFLDVSIENGITTSSVYCTTHPESVDAFFEAAHARGMCMAAGKVMMDRNGPESLCDTAETGYRDSKALIERWHGQGRLTYTVTPRFAPTSTSAQLEAAGALWREFPTTLMQTHISESIYEIEWVKELYPEAPDYLGVYETYGLIGRGANFGHAIHLTEREIARLTETGSGISHCPTSNTFIGSGLFDMQALRDCDNPIRVGMATDVGGGSSMSMFSTIKSSYEICQLQGYSLHPAKAFYLATLGSAEVLRMEDRIGNLAPGYDADIIVIDLKSKPLIDYRMRFVYDLWEALFIQMILADERAIRATFVGGKKLHQRASA